MRGNRSTALLALLCSFAIHLDISLSHESTLPAATQRQQRDQKVLQAQADFDAKSKQKSGVCRLTLEFVAAISQRPVAANLKIVDVKSGQALALQELIARPNQWYSAAGRVELELPQSELTVFAFRGVETKVSTQRIDLRGKAEARQRLLLHRFYDTQSRQLVCGNTHLHLNRISRKAADRYLQIVPQADDLDLLYVSHLERAIDDEGYITNTYDADSLKQLSSADTTLRYGEEHRHNFEGYGEGYGHVMFLDIEKLIQPVSIGPGIRQQGTDGTPLRIGINAAHAQNATVIWCHNQFGVEDLPNWLSGVLHAQNIFDGGDHGSYDASFYRYLNIGLKVPFSTGTDWFIYDLSRVFVSLDGPRSSQAWLRELAAGRSFITNGTLLEFAAGEYGTGDSIELKQADRVRFVGRGIGRIDFGGLELIHNGKVVHTTKTRRREGYHESSLQFDLPVDAPGWAALRIPLRTPKNEFGHTLFAHTSPIYLELDGRRIFKQEVARGLLVEMERNMRMIESKAIFANEAERESVLSVHQSAIAALRERVQSNTTQ